jgi:CubicO group peptidase (beta-lactamase class C family)
MTDFAPVWRSLDQQVADGQAPGLTAAVRHVGRTSYYATGTLAFDSDQPMRTGTRFRIASLSKPVGAVVALSMVADGLFSLDDPVAQWLPELAEPRVLVAPDAPVDRTVPADRPITVRDLLAMTLGQGALPAELPVAKEYVEVVHQGPLPPLMTPDEFMARFARVPLAYQPGTRWLYHAGMDVLSVLLGRVAGTSLTAVLRERVTEPLGMRATSFQTDGETLPTAYRSLADGGQEFGEYGRAFEQARAFESFGGGLVSTAEDYLTFLAALADDRLLPRELREQLTADQLTPGSRAGLTELCGPALSWGLGVALDTAVTEPWTSVGRYGWFGGAGTSAWVDPSRNLIGVVFSQRWVAGPREDFGYFWRPLSDVVPA